MREVSSVFHRDSAERPASSPDQKPSSVSPRGVLMAMPVMTTRLVIDKVHLHDRQRAYRLALKQLARADGRIVISRNELRDHLQFVARQNFGEKQRMMNFQRADAPRTGVFGHLPGAGRIEAHQAQAKLPHRLELQ